MKKQKKLKGFTLIELIIVLAIFGVILSVVMSLLDPASKIMKKASTRERTAAYADNISEYITNSITYAKFIRVYDGDFCDVTGDPLSGTLLSQEQEAAVQLVSEMLNDACDRNGQPVTGKVHILKFINTAVTDDDVNLEEGKIYESVYDFQAGAKITKFQEDPANPGSMIEVKLVNDAPLILNDSNHVPVINRDVINPEHFEDYCYHFVNGYYTLDPIEDPDNYSKEGITSFAPVPVVYYNVLNKIRNISEMEYTLNISVISYARDKDDGVTGKIQNVEHKIDDHNTEKVTLFRSPAHLNSASMALVNAKKVHDGEAVMYMKPNRDETGNPSDDKSFTAAVPGDYGEAFYTYTPTFTGVSDNLYVVYIMPNEMSDVKINYGGNSNAPVATPEDSSSESEPSTEI